MNTFQISVPVTSVLPFYTRISGARLLVADDGCLSCRIVFFFSFLAFSSYLVSRIAVYKVDERRKVNAARHHRWSEIGGRDVHFEPPANIICTFVNTEHIGLAELIK